MAAAAPVCGSSPASGGRTLATPEMGLEPEEAGGGQRGLEDVLILKDGRRGCATYPRQCLGGS